MIWVNAARNPMPSPHFGQKNSSSHKGYPLDDRLLCTSPRWIYLEVWPLWANIVHELCLPTMVWLFFSHPCIAHSHLGTIGLHLRVDVKPIHIHSHVCSFHVWSAWNLLLFFLWLPSMEVGGELLASSYQLLDTPVDFVCDTSNRTVHTCDSPPYRRT